MRRYNGVPEVECPPYYYPLKNFKREGWRTHHDRMDPLKHKIITITTILSSVVVVVYG